MDLPKRKTVRLENYDYSSPGAYFVTICTHDRRCIFSSIAVGALHEAPAESLRLTEIGQIVDDVVNALPDRFPNLFVDKYIIMPNHLHLLLRIEEDRALREAPLRQRAARSLLAQTIGYLKMNSSKKIHLNDPERKIWQRSYYEHVIRNEKDYREIWDYIDTNPLRWTEDRYYSE